MIGDVPRNINRARDVILLDRHFAPCDLAADIGEFHQRNRPPSPPSDIERAAGDSIQRLELNSDQLREVVGMEQVANLKSSAAEPGIFQRTTEVMPCHPERKDTLIRLAELPRSSDDAASIDDDRELPECAVLLAEQLCGELAGAVVRARSVGWEGFSNARNGAIE